MDKEKVLKEIQSSIKAGNTRLASEQIMALADYFSDDAFTQLTCASLLKVIEDEKGAERIAESIPGKVKDRDRLEAAKGLRGIGFPAEAEKVLSDAAENAEVIRERMRAYFDQRKYAEAIVSYGQLSEPSLEDEIIMVGSVSANKEHTRAAELAKSLLEEAPNDPGVQRCYCAALSAAGRSKEAERFVKDNLKKNRSSPDADALAAYFLWTEGKTTSAGACASKAIKGDPDNTMAMEILAYCLVEKGKLKEAKIVAGAINEKEPGNPAVVRILDMCRIAK
ncbi:MAG: tetratricopeptide repeat protein [Methanomassiliicoccaceae archaeon]|nr:tetratricopeptide repeat protein [Methanomassiliicoccaceae archaeon]